MNQQYPVTIQLPATFWDDHRERDCSETAVELKRSARLVTVELDAESWADIYSDAKHYGTSNPSHFDGDYRGLIQSAKATLRRLEKKLEESK